VTKQQILEIDLGLSVFLKPVDCTTAQVHCTV